MDLRRVHRLVERHLHLERAVVRVGVRDLQVADLTAVTVGFRVSMLNSASGV